MAETVSYTIKGANGNTKSRFLTWTLLDSPEEVPLAMAIGEKVCSSTDTDGTGSITLEPGTYKLAIDDEPNEERVTITNGGGPYRLEDLV